MKIAGYLLAYESGVLRAGSPETLEAAWRGASLDRRERPVDVCFYLPLPFLEAWVSRTPGQRDMVELTSDGRTISLTRDVHGNPGQLGVSCEPWGERVVVSTINIAFRGYNDDCTARGLVWVHPVSEGDGGDLARASFILRPGALRVPGLVAQIIREAERAVEEKVVSHFTARTTTAN